MTDTNTASGAEDDSLLVCASDLQHSAIYDNHAEMQACIRAVADRIAALASAPAQPTGWSLGQQITDEMRDAAVKVFFAPTTSNYELPQQMLDAMLAAAPAQPVAEPAKSASHGQAPAGPVRTWCDGCSPENCAGCRRVPAKEQM